MQETNTHFSHLKKTEKLQNQLFGAPKINGASPKAAPLAPPPRDRHLWGACGGKFGEAHSLTHSQIQSLTNSCVRARRPREKYKRRRRNRRTRKKDKREKCRQWEMRMANAPAICSRRRTTAAQRCVLVAYPHLSTAAATAGTAAMQFRIARRHRRHCRREKLLLLLARIVASLCARRRPPFVFLYVRLRFYTFLCNAPKNPLKFSQATSLIAF